MGVLKRLVNDEKFWLAVFGVAQSVVFHLMPEFPQLVWLAIDALVAVLIAAVAAGEVVDKQTGVYWQQRAKKE